ncbi:MAG: methylmalonyl-CoA epimerase [Anaerolineae bacterium]|nr:methylmalonyl-CoA epimerase [Anaerolineae bacterium]MDW8098201.1 methylmalonyl-CoA epimerase [Anaerolineae bacterium]
MIYRIHHIAVVVNDIETALRVYRDALGLSLSRVETIPEQDVKVAFLPTSDSEIELLEPINSDSGVAKFLAKRGEGIHHICLEVDDLEATLMELAAHGVELIDHVPRRGAYGRVAFIHPKGAHGVLIELLERFKEEK